MAVRADSSSAPSLPRRMKTNGQLAAIQPMVPHSRTRPNCSWASLRWWKQIELVSDSVGTYIRLCSSMARKKGQKLFWNGSANIARPPTRWEIARKRSVARWRSATWPLTKTAVTEAIARVAKIQPMSVPEKPRKRDR